MMPYWCCGTESWQAVNSIVCYREAAVIVGRLSFFLKAGEELVFENCYIRKKAI